MLTSRATDGATELQIGGMTCASCAGRVEKRLNRLTGVTATVNYATGKAHVTSHGDANPADLVAAVEQAGYTAAPLDRPPQREWRDRDPDDQAYDLRRRMIISFLFSTPVVLLAMVPPLQFRYWQWLALILTTPVLVWAGAPFHRAAWMNPKHATVTMDTLVSVGTTAAFLWSLYALFLGAAGEPGLVHEVQLTITRKDGAADIYLEVTAAVISFILLGRYFEACAKHRAGAALRALLELGAKEVAVLRAGPEQPVERRIPVERLAVGDVFLVRPGEKVATDGVVEQGSAVIDRSLLTGESVPVEVGPGDQVVGATVNAGGRLVVRATQVGPDTHLAQLARLVAAAQHGKARVQRLADRVAGVFVPVVIAIAVGTLGFWTLTGGGVDTGFTAAVAVLIIACPCALGLATPTALLVGTGRGAQLGIVIKGPEVLESTRRVDTVVLDKTGTVTTGQMTLVEVIPAAGVDEARLLRLAGAVEDASEHPVARAIAATAAQRVGPLPPVAGFHPERGHGVRGRVVDEAGDHTVLMGRPQFLTAHSQPLPAELTQAVTNATAGGRTVVAVGWDGQARGVLVVADIVRPTSAAAIRQFGELGLTPMLLTGDNHAVARAVAAQVGIDPWNVIAEVLPEDKVEVVKRLQREGQVVAMVGDGINDAAALAQADLGLAMGTGTDVAIEASDLTLARGDLLAAADAIRLSRRTLRTIQQNLGWALGYNTAAIPLAAVGLLNPMLAGAAMAFSSVSVVSNSLRLRRFRVRSDDPARLVSAGTAEPREERDGITPAAPPGRRPGRRSAPRRA